MIVLDASVVIALLDAGDVHNAAASNLLAGAGTTNLGISPVTLAEVLVGPTRAGRADEVRSLLHGIELEEIPWGPDAASRLATLRVMTGLKLPDCCVLLAVEQTRAESLATFDERLGRVAHERGVAVLSGALT